MSFLFRILSRFVKNSNKPTAKNLNSSLISTEHNLPFPEKLNPEKSSFGEDFIWGAASSAFQTEGASNIEGKGASIWDTFTQDRRKMQNNDYASTATNFYQHFSTDIELLKSMNFGAFRFSLSWSRLLPDGTGAINQKGIDFYNRVIDSCLEKGIAPWLTLYHWDLPQKLQDKKGWVNRDILSWFEEYTNLATAKFGDRVMNWMVLNEPMAFTSLGYLFGVHAPGKHGFRNFLPAMHHAALCQAIGGKVIRKTVPGANIGTTFSCSVVEPVDNREKNIIAANKIDAALNRLFLEPTLGLGYPINDLPFLRKVERYMQPHDRDQLKFDFDFVGLQYYYRLIIKHHNLPPFNAIEVKPALRGVLTNEMGFEVYPKGMADILRKYSSYSQIKKIIITESGVCYYDFPDNNRQVKDYDRAGYHQQIVSWLLKAKSEGAPVDGYFVWSLTDNFEWSEGIIPRFGLVYIDYNTQERILKESGKWFKQFLSGQ